MKTRKKSYLKEFFGLFKIDKDAKNKRMADLIDNDPVLKNIRKEVGDLNKKARERLAKKDPELLKLLDTYK
jgi:hypothetical protein